MMHTAVIYLFANLKDVELISGTFVYVSDGPHSAISGKKVHKLTHFYLN